MWCSYVRIGTLEEDIQIISYLPACLGFWKIAAVNNVDEALDTFWLTA